MLTQDSIEVPGLSEDNRIDLAMPVLAGIHILQTPESCDLKGIAWSVSAKVVPPLTLPSARVVPLLTA